ncbi:TIGR03440 family protein [Polaromonas sp. CF318]|uniref:ergothioneine biosynthesis protein EgtB n=1 Tax=Polaromonas sp. CF318 TaxID=1144318 RepID=UPI000271019C|nr:ergothioneine biosynthesis protein EgtB [Polaromonas sp. CF318]EJL80537.1 TIGR03440 family protein [Polaromonas sp. CF318]
MPTDTYPARQQASHTSLSPLVRRFVALRQQTEALIQPLSPEDCQLQSMPDASPAKWHLAHLTWFFETFILERFEPGFTPFDAGFRVLFNSYYNGVGDKYPRPKRGLISRPSLDEVLAYRAQVNQRMLAVMDSVEAGADSARRQELTELVTLGLHHEQQHQELLLTDIKHALSFNPARPAYASRWPLAGIHPQPVEWLRHEAGLVEHGYDAARDGEFAFDNETPRHKAYVAAFELASRPVTNGEIMAFIADKGYQRPELWLSMGWDWVTENKVSLPFYWQGSEGGEGGYQHFTLQGLIEVDPNTPACHLSYFEADAVARWAGARLPTEFEWELAARGLPAGAAGQGNFVETSAFHPLPQQEGSRGLPAQMFGDVWEWTQSNYNPYPGYKPWEGLVGEYNGKFMCNQFVLRGGSCATPQSHMRASYRNFFPPDARWQFSGLRLARDLA